MWFERTARCSAVLFLRIVSVQRIDKARRQHIGEGVWKQKLP